MISVGFEDGGWGWGVWDLGFTVRGFEIHGLLTACSALQLSSGFKVRSKTFVFSIAAFRWPPLQRIVERNH